tara:strand:+ start:14 stop:934 length:921 start_codon:yes stop_codon:yes gene_type:complete
MAGILDSKTRTMDTLITDEGRRQLASGDFQIKFVTLTDGHTFYEADVASGSSDAGARIYFEATSSPKDSVIVEKDANGALSFFDGSGIKVLDGRILSGSTVLTGSEFESQRMKIIESTPKHFEQLYSLGTKEPFLDDGQFSVSMLTASFSVTKNSPLKSYEIKKISVDQVESVFQDKRTSHVKNFLYLPPVNKRTANVDVDIPLADLKNLSQEPILSVEDLERELSEKPFKELTFLNTSVANNLVGQFFDSRSGKLDKLDIIDFGTFEVDDNPEIFRKHVFFLGKNFVDENGALTYVNLFTLVFES